MTIESAKEKIKELEENLTGKRKEKEKLLKDINSNVELKNLIKITEKFGYIQDLRKSYALKAVSCQTKFIEQFAERLGIDFELAKWTYYLEFFNLKNMNKKELIELLEKRKKFCMFIGHRDLEYVVLEGNIAREVSEKIFKSAHSKNSFLKGITASKGCATGKAKIIHNKDDFEKMEKGDILIATMTRPEFVPIMTKAGGIITDEGGITSHASIVARELKKPCVIGTKIATQVLKDGDLIEVDADKGIVKILKRA